jgi:hypothetical protein
MSEKGTGILSITAELLEQVSLRSFLPRSYNVIGSAKSDVPGVVLLIVESDDIAGHGHFLTCDVQDAGSTRTIRIELARLQPGREVSGL